MEQRHGDMSARGVASKEKALAVCGKRAAVSLHPLERGGDIVKHLLKCGAACCRR